MDTSSVAIRAASSPIRKTTAMNSSVNRAPMIQSSVTIGTTIIPASTSPAELLLAPLTNAEIKSKPNHGKHNRVNHADELEGDEPGKAEIKQPCPERRSGLLNAFPVRWSIIRSGHHTSLLDGLYKSILHGCSGAPDPNTGRLSLLCSLLIELSLVEIRSDPCVRLSERTPEDLYLGAYRPPLEHLAPRHQHASAPVRDLDH